MWTRGFLLLLGVVACGCDQLGFEFYCLTGFQDNDHDGNCLPACDHETIACGIHARCDDGTGKAVCICNPGYRGDLCNECDLGFQDNDLDGICLSDCRTAQNSHELDCGLFEGCDDSDGTAECSCVVYVNKSNPNPKDGASWSASFNTLQEGLDAAAARAGADRTCDVWVAAGVYHVYQSDRSDTVELREHVRLLGGFNGGEIDRGKLNWERFFTNLTILDGAKEGAPYERVHHVVTGRSHAVMEGFVVQNGLADSVQANDAASSGAGIYSVGAEELSISYCVFTHNLAYNLGAAVLVARQIYPVIQEASGFIRNSIFVNNFSNRHGAGVMSLYAEANIDNSLFVANGAVPILSNDDVRTGGAVAVVNSDTAVSMRHCTVAFNSAFSHAAGMHSSAYGGTIRLQNNIFWANRCLSGCNGPAQIDHDGAPWLDLEHSLIEGGESSCSGCVYRDQNNLDAPPGFLGVVDSGFWSKDAVLSGPALTRFEDHTQNWPANGLRGWFLIPDVSHEIFGGHRVQYLIVANTATTITALGDGTSFVKALDSYQIFNYELKPDSEAVNRGKDLPSLHIDINGKPRSSCGQGNCPDLGAFEFQP